MSWHDPAPGFFLLKISIPGLPRVLHLCHARK